MTQKKPILLCILDGWGISDLRENNAIAAANLPNWQHLWDSPRTLLNASEQFVGLPKGQMGNSEVGHMNIGSGRPVRQLLPRINEAIESGEFAKNDALQKFIAGLKATGGACHLLGIASNGGVHGHINHIIELMRIMNEAGVKTWLHAFTDGRDVAPTSALEQGFVASLQAACDALPHVQFATIGGRYYGMDRDNNWERVQHSYDAIVSGIGFEANNALEAVQRAYERGENDEFIKPSVIAGYEQMEPHDGVLMSNYRPDRARQIMQAFTMQDFDGFQRTGFRDSIVSESEPRSGWGAGISSPLIKNILGVADYWSEDCPLVIPAMFPLEKLENTLGAVLAEAGRTQLRIAETEKFNHVTYFLSGANGAFAGEERILIPSPKVATYDMQPEMSAFEVTAQLVAAIKSERFDFIAVNYANPDMVGHTGDLNAAIKAVEAVDKCLGELMQAIDGAGGVMLVTADHGNVEMMRDEKGNPHTQHTVNLVPFVVYGTSGSRVEGLGFRGVKLRDGGALCDIAPTILQLMHLAQPTAMTGENLII
jgi:2,3-bisphosphoglycerate-independent phosphoglycerate mutase